jgi:hypothetical protein
MKFIYIILFSLMATVTTGQSLTANPDGTFQMVNKTVLKTEAELRINATDTGKTVEHNGKQIPVFVSKNGKYFVIVQSKAGNWYRKYATK